MRVQTWLQVVSAVLGELRVKHVALMSHSAGTIYAFNTAARLPWLTYPEGGFMGCLGEFCVPLFFMLLFVSTAKICANTDDAQLLGFIHPCRLLRWRK
jgi:hypothetical protein